MCQKSRHAVLETGSLGVGSLEITTRLILSVLSPRYVWAKITALFREVVFSDWEMEALADIKRNGTGNEFQDIMDFNALFHTHLKYKVSRPLSGGELMSFANNLYLKYKVKPQWESKFVMSLLGRTDLPPSLWWVAQTQCLSGGCSDIELHDVVQRVVFGGEFSGNNETTCTPGSGAPSAVSVFMGVAEEEAPGICITSPFFYFCPTAPGAPARPSPGTLSPHEDAGEPLDDVPRIGSVGLGGGGIVSTTPGGGGDSQGSGQSPTPAGGDTGPDLLPHLVPAVVVRGTGDGRGPQYFFWFAVFWVSCGLLFSLFIALLCKCFGAPEDGGG